MSSPGERVKLPNVLHQLKGKWRLEPEPRSGSMSWIDYYRRLWDAT